MVFLKNKKQFMFFNEKMKVIWDNFNIKKAKASAKQELALWQIRHKEINKVHSHVWIQFTVQSFCLTTFLETLGLYSFAVCSFLNLKVQILPTRNYYFCCTQWREKLCGLQHGSWLRQLSSASFRLSTRVCLQFQKLHLPSPCSL